MRFRFSFNKESLKGFPVHIAIMMLTVVGVAIILFQCVLPVITKHGQSITVPNLKGVPIKEVEAMLHGRRLRYELTKDEVYLPQYAPAVVLEQYPKPGAHVKEGRRIYITLNAIRAPKVAMPDLVDGSLRHAHVTLKSRGLTYNHLTYVVDMAKNAVLEQHYKGRPIASGTFIPQGSKIDLIVGTGFSKHLAKIPDLNGSTLEEAELLLLDAGARAGKIVYSVNATEQPGTVVGQYPAAGSQLNLGSSVNLWIVESNESLAPGVDEQDLPILNG